MALSRENHKEIRQLISELDHDRALLLEKIDQGGWPELRLELAALERELGHLLIRASESIEASS